MSPTHTAALASLDAEFGRRSRQLRDALPIIESYEALCDALAAYGVQAYTVANPLESACQVWLAVEGLSTANDKKFIEKLAHWKWDFEKGGYAGQSHYWRITAPDNLGMGTYLVRLEGATDPMAIRAAMQVSA